MVRTHNIAGYGLGVMYEIIDCKRISEDEHSALKAASWNSLSPRP